MNREVPAWRASTQREKSVRRAALTAEIGALVLVHGLDVLPLRGLADRLGTSSRMLLYYYDTKTDLVTEVMGWIAAKLDTITARHDATPRVTPGVFVATVLAMAKEGEVAPFMRVWTDVIARAARAEAPYDAIAHHVISSWLDWIESRIMVEDENDARACASTILSVVEGAALLETIRPGLSDGVAGYLARTLG